MMSGSVFVSQRVSVFLVAAACAAAVPLAGCDTPATVITGTVSLDGEPVAKASLEFVPVAGDGRVSYAVSVAAGRYRAEVAPTKLLVVATATKVVGQKEDPLAPGGPPIDEVQHVLPKQYRSPEQTPPRAEPAAERSTEIDLALFSEAK